MGAAGNINKMLKGRNRGLESGIPLGGIGAGSIEFCADGRFTNITTNNNWDSPIIDHEAKIPPPPRIKEGFRGSVAENVSRRRSMFSAEGLPGAWLAVHTPEISARVLKTVSRPAMTSVLPENIHFSGRFPLATVEYEGLGAVQLALEAFSPFDLPDASEGYRNSSLPLALFHLQAHNTSNEPLPVSIAFSWQNLNGLGGYAGTPINEPDATPPAYRTDGDHPGLWFDHVPDSQADPRVLGNFSLRGWSNGEKQAVSHCVGWDPNGEGKDIWTDFARDGTFGERVLPSTAGALAFKFTIEPGKKVSVVFALAWYMPHLLAAPSESESLVSHGSPPPDPRWFPNDPPRTDYGHAYSRWFPGSWEIAGYGLENWAQIRDRILKWHQMVASSSAPEFFTDAACNDLFPLVSNSWYTQDGKYSVNEAPTDMKGCMGTVDQRAVANAAVACAFPALDRSELDLFAADQIRPENDPRQFGLHWDTRTGRFDRRLDRAGAILHDIGWDHLEGGRTGSQSWLSPHWPDLTSVFVLQVYQHAIWNGAVDWLESLYPSVKAALRFQARLDQNGDGIADLWGSGCCTYDTELYPYYGASPFVGTLYLAALRAAVQMAADFQDPEFADEVQQRFVIAQQTLEEQLWHDELGYYRAWLDRDHGAWAQTTKAHGPESLNCHIGQLAGSWWADLLGLDLLVDEDHRRRALASIGRMNVDLVAGCPANEVEPNGGYSESWPFYALVYFAAQAISAGLPDPGWKAVENIYRVRQELDGSHWDTPLEYSGKDNQDPQWGRWYMSTPASWYLWTALSGVRVDRIHRKLGVNPSWPSKWGDDIHSIPAFFPGILAHVDAQRSPNAWTVKVRFEEMIGEPLNVDTVETRLPSHLREKSVQTSVSGISPSSIAVDKGGQIVLSGPFNFENRGDGFTIHVAENGSAGG